MDYADLNNNLKIKNLQFWYGPVTENLINNNELVMDQFGINFYASRSPLIPLYIYVVYKFISTNIYVIFILKNIFFTSLIILISKKIFKKNFEVIVYSALPFAIPFNSINFLQLVPAEGFLLFIYNFFLNFIFKFKIESLILGVLIFFFFLQNLLWFISVFFQLFFGCLI